MTMALDRESILKRRKLPPVKVLTPEWADGADDGHVYVRVLLADEAERVRRVLDAAADGKMADTDAMMAVCILCVCDERGRPLFTDADKAAMRKTALAPLMRCGNKALEINCLTDEAVERMEGNSKGTTGDAPG